MECYDCAVEVEPSCYPEGECPICGLTYILGDEHWPKCDTCGDATGACIEGDCLDCHLDQ